jgi:hypothetical protein
MGFKRAEEVEDKIDNFIQIDIQRNGRAKPNLTWTIKKKGSNIYKKIASFNISYYKRNTFIQRREKEKDLIISKADVVKIFLNYLKGLDLSKYNGKVTYEDIWTFYIHNNVIRQNGIMKMYMPM